MPKGLREIASVVLRVSAGLLVCARFIYELSSYHGGFGADGVVFASFVTIWSEYFLLAVVLYIVGVILVMGRHSPIQNKILARDWILATLSLPVLFVVFHESVVCTLTPGLGINGGDAPGGCTLGWLLLGFLPILLLWSLAALFVGVPRYVSLFRVRAEMSRLHKVVVWGPVLGIVVPLAIALLFLVLGGIWESLVQM